MKQAYIAGPLFDDHEREYLVKIAEIVESFGFNTFLPHRDAGSVSYTHLTLPTNREV